MTIYDFRKYKESKILLPHIDAILKVFELTEKALARFTGYIPVQRVINVMREQHKILMDYKVEYEAIKKRKGKR